MKNKARYEFDEPESCSFCDMRAVTAPYCKINDIFVGCHINRRHPDCPLKIVPETPEGELKPCPFCGKEAMLYDHGANADPPSSTLKCFDVRCKNCNCPAFTVMRSYTEKLTAIAAWNRRVG